MITQGQVGPLSTSSSLPSGQQAITRLGNMGDTIMSELHGRYYESTYRKTMFTGATQAVIATATSAGLATSTTGLPVLYNPIGNTYNVVLIKVGYSFLLAQPTAASIIGIATGFNATTAVSGTLTSVSPKNRFMNGPAPTAFMYFSAAITLPTAPTLDMVLGYVGTGAITTNTNVPSQFDVEGSIILPPGGYAILYTSAASAASSLLCSFQWEEVPV
jgi:hypothetical protein